MSSRTQTFVVGIIGGIGSGKSAVARSLSNHFRTRIIDADRVGHEVLTLPTVKDRIRATFGKDVFDASNIDRRALAARVFGDSPQQIQSLAQLNQIVHPEIRRQLAAQIDSTDASVQLIVLDAAVMLEAGWSDLCHAVVFVEVPFGSRLARVEVQRGWDEDELRRREASQFSLDEKRQACDFTVQNDRDVESAATQVANWLEAQLS